MKIIHFSDTHLGFNDDVREDDFYDAFNQVVEYIKKTKPDYIIHTGDLFHRVSPSNKAIAFVIEKFSEIDKLNIPFIIIAGNHSVPRTTQATPIFEIFENFKNIYPSYKEYKKFEFDDVVFHTIPHINDENKANSEIDKIELSDKKNILMMHCSVGRDYLMKEFGEWVFPKEKEDILKKMDYVALGHWHGFSKVMDNVYYSGSTERTSITDNRQKGFIELNDFNVEFKPIKVRPIIHKTIDANNLEFDIEGIKEAIVIVTIKNLTPLKSIEITNKMVKEKYKDALEVYIKREFVENNKKYNKIEAISIEDAFLEHLNDERLETKVKELFSRFEEKL